MVTILRKRDCRDCVRIPPRSMDLDSPLALQQPARQRLALPLVLELLLLLNTGMRCECKWKARKKWKGKRKSNGKGSERAFDGEKELIKITIKIRKNRLTPPPLGCRL